MGLHRTISFAARTMTAVLTASVVTTLATSGTAAAVSGPTTALPGVPSVPVQQQTMSNRPPDPASVNALSGNQGVRADKDGSGTYGATSLSPSATWKVSEQTGDFTTSYPLRVPPVPGALRPNLALSYRSSAVDGRTSATNNQPSWIGDGWDLSPGFVERVYGGCITDTDGGPAPQTGDLCWRSDNAVASFDGHGGQLIRDDASGAWHPKNDDGSRVERLTGAGNGDDNGEYWKITTVDGTQYFFGSEVDSKSADTAPVFGDDAGEPCHGATYETSRCTQAWRWNLDKVIDRNGNEVRYFYEQETNSYGLNLKDNAVSYVRSSNLVRAEYGLNVSVSAPAVGRVLFTLADRCVPGSDCSRSNKGNWPDTPLDLVCDQPTCTKYSPSFFSTRRLAGITTQVRSGSGYSDVDRWDLDQQYPDPGDGQKAALWLKGIRHTGLVGGSLTLPSMTLEGNQFANRVLKTDGISGLNRYRLTGIVSETGGVTSITYALPECKAGGPLPTNPETNTLRCFPVRWARPNEQERTDYFHKYVVAQVVQSDRLSSSTEQVTSYEYLDGAAWHWDMSEFAKDDKKTWDEFRGFGKVRVRAGTDHDPAGPITLTEDRFYRGMNGDRLPNNGTRSVSVTDSEGGSHPDEDQLSGFSLESATYNGSSVVAKTITDPVWRGPTATRGAFKAYFADTGTQRQYTALGTGGWRITRTETAFNEHGLPVSINDLGDTGTAADDRCTTTSYAENSGAWLLNLPGTVETVAVACGTAPTFPRDAIAATRNSYDGKGNPTRAEVAGDRPAAGPVYVTTATAAFDGYGRTTRATDAGGNTTTTAYAPATGGPVTSITVTSPPTTEVPGGLVTTTNLDPAFGQPTLVTDPNRRRTELTYDALGRRTQVWQPNRPRAANPEPSLSFTYQVRNDAPTVVGMSAIGPNGRCTTTNTLFDGLLRQRQTQGPAAGGGRLITDTRYDSQGRAYKQTQPYFTDAPVDDKLWVASDTDVPALTRTEFDGAGRPVAAVFESGATEQWRTTTGYGGDRTTVTPPAGDTATTQLTDARGQLTELRQYLAGGGYQSTSYGYDPAGHLVQVTAPGGAVWRYGYDLRGRKITTYDPDNGLTTLSYNDLNQVTATRDARGITVSTAFDALGRPTRTSTDTPTPHPLVDRTYDTAFGGKGKPATATRYAGANAYTTSITSYSSLYEPTETSVTIPAAEGLLAGTYTSYAGYGWDGSLSGQTYAEAGDLPEETVNYVRDDAGRPLSSSGGYAGATVELVTATDYTRYGEPQRVQLGAQPKRAWLSYVYDPGTRRLARSTVDTETPAPMQADVHYSYDPAGNITSIADTVTGQAADTQCFRYDALRRLSDAWTAAGNCAANPSTGALGGPAPYWLSYSYAANGNRTTETAHAGTGDTVRGYTYGQAQPHAVQSATTNGATTGTFTYDRAGNTLTRPGQALSWDPEGRLESVTQNGQTVAYTYGPDGELLLRKDSTGTTLFIDKQEIRLASTGGRPTATRYYAFGDNTIAVRQGASLTWLANDNQGSAQVAVNRDTLQVVRRRQLPFGGTRGGATTWPGDHGFVGGVQDPGTGLVHLGAREYDPVTGRFLSVDPVTATNDAQQLQGYDYGDDNPVTFADPSGLCSGPDGIGCRSQVSKEGYGDLRDPANQARYEAARNTWLANTGKPSIGNGVGGKCPDGAKSCKPAQAWVDAQKQKNDKLAEALRNRVKQVMGKHISGIGLEKLVAYMVNKMTSGEVGSLSLCFETSIGLVYGIATERCDNWDETGATTSYLEKKGWWLGASGSFGWSLKLNSEHADEVAKEMRHTFSAGFEVGLGPFISLEGEWDADHPNESRNLSIKGAVGIGADFGCSCHTTKGENSGYYEYW